MGGRGRPAARAVSTPGSRPVPSTSHSAIGLSKEDLKIVKEKMTNMVFYSNFHFYRIFLTFLI